MSDTRYQDSPVPRPHHQWVLGALPAPDDPDTSPDEDEESVLGAIAAAQAPADTREDPNSPPGDDAPIVFVATQTMAEFMTSPAYVRVLAGPVGGGKSVCCVHELMNLAMHQVPNSEGVRRTRFLVVRNTADQLRSTTLKTIKDWFPATAGFGRWAATERTLYYRLGMPDGTIVDTEWMLRALDDEADVANALSLEVTAMWGNECRELHPAVVAALLKRTNRFPSKKTGGGFATRAGAIFDTNMPGMETWWEQKMSEPPDNWSIHLQPPAVLPVDEWIKTYGQDPEPWLVATAPSGNVFAVDPNADNVPNLAPSYYTDAVASDKDDDIDIYLRCHFGRTMSGLPVYDTTFKHNVHVSKEPLDYVRSQKYPLCIGVDCGRTPAAVITQATPAGRLLVLGELHEIGMGMQQFALTKLRPFLNERYPGVPCFVAVDPAGWAKSQGNEKSPVDYLREAGFQVVRPYTNKIEMRIGAVEQALMASADAQPRVAIAKSCTVLIKGMRGGYKWATNKTGELTNESEPIKNHPESDIQDAFQYACMVVDGNYGGNRPSARREVRVANARGWT